MLTVICKLPDASIESVIVETLKENVPVHLSQIVVNYAWFFVAEVKHFMGINKLLKPKASV
jgi:hypothetical protein